MEETELAVGKRIEPSYEIEKNLLFVKQERGKRRVTGPGIGLCLFKREKEEREEESRVGSRTLGQVMPSGV